MSIDDLQEKIKPLYGLLLLLTLAGIFFSLGRLYDIKNQSSAIKIQYQGEGQAGIVLGALSSSTESSTVSALNEKDAENTPKTIIVPTVPQSEEVIGSKSGKKYYFPWCGTVKRIKPENQVHFASIAEAKAAGFTPGGNCKGLQ